MFEVTFVQSMWFLSNPWLCSWAIYYWMLRWNNNTPCIGWCCNDKGFIQDTDNLQKMLVSCIAFGSKMVIFPFLIPPSHFFSTLPTRPSSSISLSHTICICHLPFAFCGASEAVELYCMALKIRESRGLLAIYQSLLGALVSIVWLLVSLAGFSQAFRTEKLVLCLCFLTCYSEIFVAWK